VKKKKIQSKIYGGKRILNQFTHHFIQSLSQRKSNRRQIVFKRYLLGREQAICREAAEVCSPNWDPLAIEEHLDYILLFTVWCWYHDALSVKDTPSVTNFSTRSFGGFWNKFSQVVTKRKNVVKGHLARMWIKAPHVLFSSRKIRSSILFLHEK